MLLGLKRNRKVSQSASRVCGQPAPGRRASPPAPRPKTPSDQEKALTVVLAVSPAEPRHGPSGWKAEEDVAGQRERGGSGRGGPAPGRTAKAGGVAVREDQLPVLDWLHCSFMLSLPLPLTLQTCGLVSEETKTSC